MLGKSRCVVVLCPRSNIHDRYTKLQHQEAGAVVARHFSRCCLFLEQSRETANVAKGVGAVEELGRGWVGLCLA